MKNIGQTCLKKHLNLTILVKYSGMVVRNIDCSLMDYLLGLLALLQWKVIMKM